MKETVSGHAEHLQVAGKEANQQKNIDLKFSRAQLPVKLDIATTNAQQIFGSEFETTSKAMYFISVMMHVIDTESNASAAEQQVSKILSSCIEKLQNKKAVIKELLDSQGCSEPEGFTYTNVLSTVVTVDSPRMITYLNILRELDGYIRLLDVAWFFSLVDDKTRLAETFKAKRIVTDDSYRIRSLWLRVLRAAHAKNIAVKEEADNSLTVTPANSAASPEDSSHSEHTDDAGDGSTQNQLEQDTREKKVSSKKKNLD